MTDLPSAADTARTLIGECSIGYGDGCQPHHGNAGDGDTCDVFDKAVQIIQHNRRQAWELGKHDGRYYPIWAPITNPYGSEDA